MKKGKVVSFNPTKGYGWILGKDGKDYFAHCSKIVIRTEPRLYVSEYVQFESVQTSRNYRNESAINIQPVSEIEDLTPYQIVHNPFNPRFPINRPAKFAGRKENIKSGTTSLVNMQNILVTGARGIGKSSFANQLLYIAEGDSYLLDKMKFSLPKGRTFSFVTISIRTLPGTSLKDIAALILRELIIKFDLKKKHEIEHEIDLQLYKFKSKALTQSEEYEEVLDIFGYDLIKIHDAMAPIDGILVLIDEVENIDPDSHFANFVKNLSEYFVSEERHINFILSGIPCSIINMFLQHPSFLRLFDPIELIELSTIESYELLDIYLASRKKTVKAKAKTNLCKFARGYPVNLQLLGFYTYQMDSDSCIDNDDLTMAIEYLIAKIKKDEFHGKHESIGYGLPEKILKFVIRERQGLVISYKELSKKFEEETEQSISDAIQVLVENEVMTKYEKGKYFIGDYLFHRYLQKYYKIPIRKVNL